MKTFFSSDEDEDVKGMSKEERLARKKARFEEKLKKQDRSKKNKAAEKFFGPEQEEEAEDSKKEEAPEKEASAKKKRQPVFKRVRKRIPLGLKGRLSRVASECSAPTPKKRATSAFIFTTKARTNSETFEETTIEKKP